MLLKKYICFNQLKKLVSSKLSKIFSIIAIALTELCYKFLNKTC